MFKIASPKSVTNIDKVNLLTDKMILFFYWRSFSASITWNSVIIILWIPDRPIQCRHGARFLKGGPNSILEIIF